MGKIKNAGVCAGIAVGGVIGGAVSLIGKMADRRAVDQLGQNIMDSTILTGEIVGNAASGAARLASGTLGKDPAQVRKGKKELRSAGERVVGNIVGNVRLAAEQGGEILEGVRDGDRKRVARGLTTLGKMAVVGMLTVGAIKVDSPAETAERAEPGPTGPEPGEPADGGRPVTPAAAPAGDAEPVGPVGGDACADGAADRGCPDADCRTPEPEEKADVRELTLEEELERKIRF